MKVSSALYHDMNEGDIAVVCRRKSMVGIEYLQVHE